MRSMLRRVRRWLRRTVIADEPENTMYGLYDDYLEGLLSRAQYEQRAQRAFRAANKPIPCDDCHRTDGTHDLEVEH